MPCPKNVRLRKKEAIDAGSIQDAAAADTTKQIHTYYYNSVFCLLEWDFVELNSIILNK